MDSFYLFTTSLTEVGCDCVKLSETGSVTLAITTLSFAQIRDMQRNCTTVVVLPCRDSSIFKLELPWLAPNKAKLAIPYALEDKIAQPLNELHFSFDKAHYHNNHYLIVATEKSQMISIMSLLTEEAIVFETITLDWFALEPGELALSKDQLLVSHDDFQGGLSGTLATNYLKKHEKALINIFQDTNMPPDNPSSKHELDACTWMAQRLQKNTPMNLCQGPFQHGTNVEQLKKGFQLAAVLGIAWLCSILIVNGIHLTQINKEAARIDEQITTIYHHFFPDAKQVVSPKFRISQLLNNSQNENQERMWFLTSEFAKNLRGTKLQIDELRYQNNHLTLTVQSPDFDQLELLEKKLKASHIKVNQTKAVKHEQQVIATLELS